METGEFGVQDQIVHLDLNQNSRFDGSNLVNSSFDMVPILNLRTSTSTISVVSAEAVSKVRVTINVQHTWNEDLDIALISPTGVRVWLVQDRGGDTNGFSGTVFDDNAAVPISNGTFPFSGVFRPETPLAALNGGPANGTWTLEIFDDNNFDEGNLLSWSLEIDTIEPHQFANELGFVGLDLNAGANEARLEPVGIWDYSTPSDGVHTLVANPAAPTSSIFYGIFFENFAPTVLTLAGNSVFENRPPATLVGRLSTTDPNSRDSFSYSLVDGSGAVDNGMFEIVGSQLTTAVSFNFEDSPTRMVRIRTTDSGGLSIEREFTISIRDVNEPPTGFTLSSSTIQENSIAPYFVGSIVVDDPDIGDQGTHSFRFNSSTQFPDNNLFEIRGSSLYSRVTFSFESRGVYVLSVRAIDSMDAFVDAIVPITITDVNEAPTSIDATSASFLESLPVASVVTRLVAADQDVGDTISFSLVSGVGSDDNAEFLVSGNQLLSRNAFDFETKSSYRARVRATDASGLWTETPFTFTVQDVNEMPNTLNLSSTSVNEGLAIGSRVGNFSALDPDAISTFTFATKMSPAFPDNDAFSIVGNELRTNEVFRYAQKNSYSILVQVTDQGGLSIDRVFTINVLDVNDTPTDVSLSFREISESAANDSLVGQLSTVDADAGDSFVYSLVAGAGSADNASFRIAGNQLRTNSILNFEAKPSYAIRIESRDAAGASFERSFVIQVLNENEAPTAVRLSGLTIRENNSPNASIGSLSSIDPDTAQSFTYSLVNGAGDRDNNIFVIAGTTLRTTVAFDFEAKPDYQVRIRTTDGGGLSFELPFVISVQNANESPFGLQLLGSLTENAPLNSVALNAVASDPDANDPLTFSLISGIGSDDNGKFAISANGGLSPVAAVNFESQSSYKIRVRVVDQGGIAIEQALAIAVVNQNEAPTNVMLSETGIDENQSPNAVIGLFTVVDQDVADSSSFSLVNGAGDTDNNLFVVSGNTLQATSSFDFETKNRYSLRVRATDVGGLSFEKTILVSVKDVNEQPFAVNLTSSTLLENAAIGSAIGDLRTIDVDALDRFSYSLVAGAGDSDNGQFVLVGATLRTNSVFDFESRETYTIRVRTQDQGGLSIESPLTISIRDINDLPSNLQIQSSLINENSQVGTSIGAFTASDQDAGDVISYRLVTGNNDNSLFSILNGTLTSNTLLNFESRSSYQVSVQAIDRSGSGPTQTFTITVRDVNETPTNIALDASSINENGAAGAVVGRLSATDPDANEQFTFTLVSGEGSSGNSLVTINGTQLVLVSALNFESSPVLAVRVRATDAAFNTFEKALNITVVDLPEAPTEVRLSSAAILENLPAGTVVGTLSTIDPDAGGSFTYQIVAGQSSLPFAIVGNQLRTTRKLNFEALATYTVSIRSTDASSLSVVSPLLISVLDVNEQAIITGGDSATTPTNRTVVIDVLANDRDPDGTIDRTTVVIVAPPTRGSVRVLVDGRLEYTPPVDERLDVSFSYQVLDNDQVLSNVGLVAVRVLSAYQNPRNRLDVDNDGDVSPLDVLQIINDIEANQFRDLPTNVGETVPYIDTNGNSKVDPLDVLDVINFLNLGAGESAEGEQSSYAADLESQKLEPVFGESMQAAHAMAIDAFYRELEVKRGRSRS
jgi:subtilisin-like proprotein convertase family protein